MIASGSRRPFAFVAAIVLVTILFLWFHDANWISSTRDALARHAFSSETSPYENNRQRQKHLNGGTGRRPTSTAETRTALEDGGARKINKDMSLTHSIVRSVSNTAYGDERPYFEIDFGEEAINPNIIPHPHWNDTWIIVAQKGRSYIEHSVWAAELICNAQFSKNNERLACISPPVILPVAATFGDNCVGDLAFFHWNVGPHDARVFHGPKNPYTIYGSNSQYTCFGQWIQDFRLLTDWGLAFASRENFGQGTELQRPFPYRPVEKNWFVFWDKTDEVMYTHYDISPKRVFSKLNPDGSSGPDLAHLGNPMDAKCMAKYMPKLPPKLESIHQATNSLRITTCRRSDPSCVPSDENTFIITMFQHKTFYDFHSVYEPYVMLFRQSAPFDIHAISRKPLWIEGRGYARKPYEAFGSMSEKQKKEALKKWKQMEMFYVTSISWKDKGLTYHGYADDTMFLAFGIEDMRTAGIDVRAEDLLQNLGLCKDADGTSGILGDIDDSPPPW